MGSPKALLRLRGESFLSHLVRAFLEGGCTGVTVVTGPLDEADSARIAEEATRLGATLAVNPDRSSQQIESLRAALRSLPSDVGAALVSPVDAPGASPTTVAALIGAWREGAWIAMPSHGGRRGHPVLFSREVIPELLDEDLAEGARTVIQRHADLTANVAVSDPAVLLDIDTPADYQRLREGAR